MLRSSWYNSTQIGNATISSIQSYNYLMFQSIGIIFLASSAALQREKHLVREHQQKQKINVETNIEYMHSSHRYKTVLRHQFVLLFSTWIL